MHDPRFYITAVEKLGLSLEVAQFLKGNGILNIGQVLDLMMGKFNGLPLEALSDEVLSEITDKVAEYEADYRSRFE